MQTNTFEVIVNNIIIWIKAVINFMKTIVLFDYFSLWSLLVTLFLIRIVLAFTKRVLANDSINLERNKEGKVKVK